jgi:signal recognition particle receptor subunit beta
MALVNDAKKEIHAKIVYFGPGQSGKTTNLEFIYSKLKPEYRGKFKFMNIPSGKMVFFDFMRPELAGIKDFSIHFHIYTVTGDDVDSVAWKNVLKGADGVVFVADAEPSRMLQNRKSLESLKECLGDFGIQLEDMPFIFQFNKRDLPDALSIEEMNNLLDAGDCLQVPAKASQGEGVLPTLSEIMKKVLQKLRDASMSQDAVESENVEELPTPVAAGETVGESLPHQMSEETESEPILSLEEMEPALALEAEEEDDVSSVETDEKEDLTEIKEEEEENVLALSSEEEFSMETEPVPMLALSDLVPEEPELSSAETVPEEKAIAEVRLMVTGAMEAIGGGRFRLPLAIKCGDTVARTALVLGITFEKPEQV